MILKKCKFKAKIRFLTAVKINFAVNFWQQKIKKCFEINSPLTSIEAEYAKGAKIAVMIVKYEIVPNMPVTEKRYKY